MSPVRIIRVFSLGALLLLGPPSLEAAPVSWNTNSSGLWNVAANWSPGLPTSADDVTINRGAANPTISLVGSDSITIRSLTNAEILDMAGGAITLTNGASTSTGSFLHNGITGDPGLLQVNGAGVSFTATGTVSLGGGSLAANTGGVITMTAATTVSGHATASPSMTATGASSSIDLNNVTNWSGSTGGQTTNVRAVTGGFIDLDSVATISNGSTRFESQGAGSTIELTALTSFSRTAGNATSYLWANGGTILTPNLTTLTNADLAVSGAGTINTAGINSMTGSGITADSNGDIAFPALTAYTGSGSFTPLLRATGAGSTIDLNNVTNWSGGTSGQTVNVQAFSGGFVDLDSVATIANGSTRFESQGAGSTIELTALTSFSRTVGNATSYLWANGGTILTPNLTTLTNADLAVSGAGTINTAGINSMTGSGITADSNGDIALPALTAYTGSGSFSPLIRATGAGSTIDLNNVTNWTGGTGGQTVNVQAFSGGFVDLDSVATLANGSTRFEANGAGSTIELTALTSFSRTAGNATSYLWANGGTILTPNLTTLTNADLAVSGAGTINTAGINSMTGSGITADSNGDIAFPALTAYTGSGSFSPLLRATGAGSTIDLNNVTNWSGSTGGQTVNVQAFSGGFVDLDSVATISVGSTRFEAQGSGSTIELTALTSFTRAAGNATSYLWANGGAVLTPNLTTVNDISLQIDGAGTINTAGITNANGSSLYSRNSGQLSMPALVTYTGPSTQSGEFNPSGAGTVVNLPALTTLNGATAGQSLNMLAQSGGTINANAVTSIPNGRVQIRAEGANSVVNVMALATFNSTIANSLIEATTGGTINLKPTATTGVTNVETRLNAAGTINVGTLVMQSGSTLTGVGTLQGSLNNAAGQIRPNGGLTGIQSINGNLTQAVAGSYELHLSGLSPGTQHDQVNVTGSATLGGTVNVLRSGSFTPAFGDTFRILNAASVADCFTGLTNFSNTGTPNWIFALFYQPTGVDLKVVLAGDANGDGVVSGADYTIWNDNFGQMCVGYARGDFNSDGVVSGADYTIWNDNYNAMAPGPVAVPEPTGLALAAAALAVLGIGRGVAARRARP